MKKLTLTAALITLLPFAAHAADTMSPAASPVAASVAGYTGPGSQPAIRTIAQALQGADDARFVLEGQLLRKLGHERYEFADASGKGEVEIDDKRLPGVNFDHTTRVRLSGEIDKEWYGKREIEVKRVDILN